MFTGFYFRISFDENSLPMFRLISIHFYSSWKSATQQYFLLFYTSQVFHFNSLDRSNKVL
jgi:hypothetical protein